MRKLPQFLFGFPSIKGLSKTKQSITVIDIHLTTKPDLKFIN